MEGVDYSNSQIDQSEMIASMSQQNKQLENQNSEMAQAMAAGNFNEQEENNLIHYQLETDKILERIEHFLKGDRIKVDNTGNVFYETPADEKLRNFNEYGVSELMRIISMYVTKETFLSYYDEERINEIIGDLGDALADFIYCNYEKMGMDTKYKESKYVMIVLNILHTIESCYRRALSGNEQENLRTRSIVTQNNQMNPGMGRNPVARKKWNPFNPTTW